MSYKLTGGESVFKIFNLIFLLLLASICIYPFWYVIIGSLSDPFEFKPSYFWPRTFFSTTY